jgi:hypothetical protein
MKIEKQTVIELLNFMQKSFNEWEYFKLDKINFLTSPSCLLLTLKELK